jgi:predicted membrane protein
MKKHNVFGCIIIGIFTISYIIETIYFYLNHKTIFLFIPGDDHRYRTPDFAVKLILTHNVLLHILSPRKTMPYQFNYRTKGGSDG